jgi:acetate kinase
MKILVLNSGSSSQKASLYDFPGDLPREALPPLWEGKIEWEGDDAEVTVRNSTGVNVRERAHFSARAESTRQLVDTLWKGTARVINGPSEIAAAGHRIVHGGPHLRQPTLITPEVKSALAAVAAFAPLHNRAELEGVELVEKGIGAIPQFAVFDTGFHSHLPGAAAVYSGPYEWVSRGIRRYGFHGINHQYCAERAAQLLGRELQELRLITCHLGNGCSLAAIKNGQSVDTTMGFTPLEGLMMGTRSGSVDPGILTYLMREDGFNGQQLDDVLNKKSGLLGISGISGDMREIVHGMNAGNPRAKLAFEIFVHRLRSGIGAMLAVLGGLDCLVFSAGIGENSPEVRAAACRNFDFAGVKIDNVKNADASHADREISSRASAVRVLVVGAQEDWAIAQACWRMLPARTRGQASAS